MAKSTVTAPPVEAATTADFTADLGLVEKRLALVESKLDELAKTVDELKAAAPVDNSGLSGALAALEARVSSYIGRGR